MNHHSESGASVLASLSTTERGLSTAEAERRLLFYGTNELPAKKTTSWRLIVNQFNSPVIWLLVGALFIAYSFGQALDAGIILAILVVNAVLGFIQEYKAERAIAALAKRLALRSTVLRDGVPTEIEAAAIVPGDVMILTMGMSVPADGRILRATMLSTNEASLTGESQPVNKSTGALPSTTGIADRTNMAFCGTTVTTGNGAAVVTGTGSTTELGKIAHLLRQTFKEQTPLQKKINTLSTKITILVMAIAALILFLGVLQGQAMIPLFLLAVAVAVAAVPESLPAVLTLTLAIGVQRMSKRNALVRKLSAVQTLGACTIIFTDKTGTLTRNEMSVREIYVPHKRIAADDALSANPACAALLRAGASCNNAVLVDEGGATRELGDPTEVALLRLARDADISPVDNRIGEIPFTADRKRMTTIHRHNGRTAYVKGAPSTVLELCTRKVSGRGSTTLTSTDRRRIDAEAARLAGRGLRVLAFATRTLTARETIGAAVERDLVFLGLQAMHDAPRPEAKEALRLARQAGIRVVMITGDHPATAATIAREIGITGRVMTGEDLDRCQDLYAQTRDVGVLARVNPVHKLRLVEAYKAHGQVVAMTGDGVNDAPALKAADIGVAMGKIGTDVAREASDMVLADDNFATIVEAIRGGRAILDNIVKFVTYILSANTAEVLTVFGGMLGFGVFPMTLIMILWMNLVTDGLPALALAVERPEPLIMRRRPDPVGAPLLTRPRLWRMAWSGLGMTIIGLGLFWLRLPVGLIYAQTLCFTSLVLTEMAFALSSRSERSPLLELGPFSNRWLILSVTLTVLLQIMVVQTPFFQGLFGTTALSALDWSLAAGGALVMMLLRELDITLRNR